MGGYEPNPRPWAGDGHPRGLRTSSCSTNDWDHFEPMMELALGRVPALETAGIKQFINGPESFTPDGNFILGEAPEVEGFFVGAGFNAFGIASGGGAGMALAEWVAKGEPPYDLWPVDIRRFGRNHLSTPLGAHPHARGLRQALHHGLAARGIRLRPAAPPLAALRPAGGARAPSSARSSAGSGRTGSPARARSPRDVYTFGRPNWFEAVGREHRACREAAALFDQTSFAKFLMVGPRRRGGALLDLRRTTSPRPPGTLTYTQMLNARGGIECDLTVARLAEDAYYIVTGTGFATHDFDWIAPQHPAGPRRAADRRDLAVRRAGADGAAGARHPRGRRRGRRLERRPSRSAACRRLVGRRRAGASRCASPMSASSAGSCTSRSSSPPRVYDALMAAGAAARPRRRRLPRDRVAAAGEGLPRLGRRHRPGPLAADGGPRLRGEAARQHRPSSAARRWRRSARRPLPRLLAGFTVADPDGGAARPRDDLPRRPARRLAGERRLGLHRRPRASATATSATPRTASTPSDVLAGSYELEVATERVPAEVFLRPPYDPEAARVKG